MIHHHIVEATIDDWNINGMVWISPHKCDEDHFAYTPKARRSTQRNGWINTCSGRLSWYSDEF